MNVSEELIREIVTKVLEEAAGAAKPCCERQVDPSGIIGIKTNTVRCEPFEQEGVKLKDVADVVLDNCSLVGDAATEVEGFPMKVGSTSTIPAVFLQNAILVEMVEVLVRRGLEPDVYYNGHMAFMDEGCADHNDRLVDKYFYRIRNL